MVENVIQSKMAIPWTFMEQDMQNITKEHKNSNMEVSYS